MNRKEYLRLHDTEFVPDPKNPGKLKPRARYVGPHYTISVDQLKRDRVILLVMMAVALVGYLCGGLTKPQVLQSRAMLNTTVMFSYLIMVVPLCMIASALTRILRIKTERITEMDRQDGFGRMQSAAMVMLVLSAMWLIGDVVCLVIDGTKAKIVDEVLFLIGSVLMALSGAVLFGWARKFPIVDPRKAETKRRKGKKNG